MLRRDRVTWLVHGQLAVFGYFLFGFEPVVPLLRSQFGTSRAVAGLHGTAIALGSVLAGLAYPRLTARLGRGRTSWVGVGGLCAGLVVLCGGERLELTMVGALVCGGFGALLVAGSGPILAEHHGPAGAAAITETNAVAAGTGLLGPACIGAAVAAGAGWRPALFALVAPAGVLALIAGRTRVPDGMPPGRGAGPADRLPRRYWPAWLVVVAIIAVEFSIMFWSADLLRTREHLSAGAATASVSAIVAGMFVGRLAGRGLTLRQELDPLLLGALALAALGFIAFWSATRPAMAVPALALTGLGMSLHYPLAVARAIAASDGRGNRAAGCIAIAVGCAGMTAPVALGGLADALGTHRAFLLVPVFLTLAASAVMADGVWRVSRAGPPTRWPRAP